MEIAKPRILFLLTSSDWGGVQFFVHQLALEAKRRGCTVMIASGGDGELGKRCEESLLHFRHLKMMKREISPFYELASLHELRLLIREFRPDAVHLNSSKMGVVGSLAANLERVPLVAYRIGGWSFLEDVSALKKKLYLWMEKFSASKKDIIVTVHPGDEKIARENKIIPRRYLTSIPNGIDLEKFDRKLLSQNEARAQLNLPKDEIVIGTIANFYAPKNLSAYLKTIAPLAMRSNLRFAIIGDGPERVKLENLHRELKLGEKVILAGRCQDAQRLLSAFNIFTLPSSKEGMPWALLEAMSARLPCIATDVGACKWMLAPDAGITVPANDSSALISALENLIASESERARLGLNARRKIETDFRWETALEKSLALLTVSVPDRQAPPARLM